MAIKSNFRRLTVVRLMGGLLAALIALGRWEHRLFFRRSGPTAGQARWLWLIALGYGVEQAGLALYAGPKRLLAGLLWLLVLAVKLMWWPFGRAVLAVAALGTAGWRLINNFKTGVRAAPAATKTLAKKLTPRPRWSFLRPVAAFAVLLAIIILPLKFYGNWQALTNLKNRALTAAQAALGEAWSGKQAVEQKDFSAANSRFSRASANFLAADAELQKVNGFLLTLAGLLPNAEARLAAESSKIAAAGNLGAGMAGDLSLALDSLFAPQPEKDIVTALAGFTEHGAAARDKADRLAAVLAEINLDSLPDEYREDFLYWQDRVKFLSASLNELVDLSGKLRLFLGETYDRRYLLIFQNNTEARAAGGFMGSFAIADFSRGRLKSLTVPGGGVYDTEAGLRAAIVSPEPLQLIKARWYMWDANWWPDWPTSARKIMWFYEASDGSTVDGVISLTPEVIIKLLTITGPIDLTADYGATVTADNFMAVVQPIAEQKDTATPKKIIGDLTEKLMAKLTATTDQQTWLKIVGVIEQALNEKHLLLYFTDPELEAKVADLGWDGRLKATGGDYLQVVNTNIAGGKSDAAIKQTVELTTNVLADGSLINNLKIIRDHEGVKGEAFSGVRNVNWLRVYVPLGSKLLEASGFSAPERDLFETVDPSWLKDDDLLNENSAEIDGLSGTKIYREQDKTVFANWSMVDPGQATVVNLSYKLPFKLEARPSSENWLDKLKSVFAQTTDTALYRHSLLVQKQLGSANSEVNYNFAVPSAYDLVWQYPEGVSAADYLAQDTDKYWGYILQAKN